MRAAARSPLRISLGGGGTDLPGYFQQHGGFVLACAIDRYVTVEGRRDDHGPLRFRSGDEELVADDAEGLAHPIVREALRARDITGGVSLASSADIPSGTGLGSSGSFGTALQACLDALEGQREVSPARVAEAAYHVEVERLDEPVGKQDPYAAAFGGLHSYRIERDGAVVVEPLTLPAGALAALPEHLLLFWTGLRRSASAVLEEQRARTAALDPAVLRSLRETHEVGLEARDALLRGDLAALGPLFDRHWTLKRERSHLASNDRIEALRTVGARAGATGGKIVGAGGGGFLLFVAPDPEPVRRALGEEGLEELRWRPAGQGTELVGAAGA